MEAFLNLVAVTPPCYRDRIVSYAKEVESEVVQDDQISFYADLFKAVKKAVEVTKTLGEDLRARWGGTGFWVDPREGLIRLWLTQFRLGTEPVDSVFQDLVYQALAD